MWIECSFMVVFLTGITLLLFISLMNMKQSILIVTVYLFLAAPSFAQNLKVAVSANLQGVIKVLAKDFKERTGIVVEPIVGSSGNLSAQIKNGAPFDLFLSADMNFPETLYKEGFSVKAPAVYAYGKLIICSIQNIGFENWERLLLSQRIKKIAIANPAIAPYGKAAEESLKLKGIQDDIRSKIVTGESIAQINTYITTGVVDVGFTTRSLVKDMEGKTTLYWQDINPKSYTPIRQGMIITRQTRESAKALKFYEYMLSPAAKAILKEYGYGV
ncbi:MAG: modA [Mucilaginibacter sp.]|nr:modA [Mucilaginibacter sp.]